MRVNEPHDVATHGSQPAQRYCEDAEQQRMIQMRIGVLRHMTACRTNPGGETRGVTRIDLPI
jgi:hypothetical protein